jgi:hypothetical protein
VIGGPNALDQTQDQILTVAYKSDTANFSQFSTYAITDSMTFVYNKKKIRVKNDTTITIANQIIQKMQSLGYTQVDPDDSPNLLVDMSYLQTKNMTVYPGYWDNWDWWWGGYYNYYSPWFPYYPYSAPMIVSYYTTGSIIIELADVKNISTSKSVPIVWHGLIRGILNGSHTKAEWISAINELFTILPPKN